MKNWEMLNWKRGFLSPFNLIRTEEILNPQDLLTLHYLPFKPFILLLYIIITYSVKPSSFEAKFSFSFLYFLSQLYIKLKKCKL